MYGNKRPALLLDTVETGERMAVATINMPDMPLLSNQVVIKDYSENEGMLKTLVDAGVIEPPFSACQTGFVLSPICHLTEQWV